MMQQIIVRIVKGINFIFEIKKYRVFINFIVFKIIMFNFYQEENISGYWNL